MEKFSLVLKFYKKALKTKPNLAIFYFSVADIFLKLGDYYSAKKHCRVSYGSLIYKPKHNFNNWHGRRKSSSSKHRQICQNFK